MPPKRQGYLRDKHISLTGIFPKQKTFSPDRNISHTETSPVCLSASPCAGVSPRRSSPACSVAGRMAGGLTGRRSGMLGIQWAGGRMPTVPARRAPEGGSGPGPLTTGPLTARDGRDARLAGHIGCIGCISQNTLFQDAPGLNQAWSPRMKD